MNIYVGNLPLEMTGDELRQEFSVFGPVISVSVMNDKYIGSGQPRGYAFVNMGSKSEGEAAISGLSGKLLRGRAIDVIAALPLSDNSGLGLSRDNAGSRVNRKWRERRR